MQVFVPFSNTTFPRPVFSNSLPRIYVCNWLSAMAAILIPTLDKTQIMHSSIELQASRFDATDGHHLLLKQKGLDQKQNN